MRTVSILGCGWLGEPLALYLKDAGFSVRGSVRDPEKLPALSEKGIEPYLIDIAPEINAERADEFFSSDVLFINFPPERRDDIETYHEKQIRNLIGAISNPRGKMVIFASSTSVYPNTNGVVREEDSLHPEKPSGKALLRVERLLMEQPGIDTTVIRFSGLIGYDRAPIKSIRRKKLVLNPDCPLNLIHRDDCIGIVKSVIDLDVRNTVLNATCDEHPTRREYYSREARKYGIPLPLFETESAPEYKIVSNEKLKETLGYRMIYPDPLGIP
ncbi:MAG: SDR family oxidoreductase [Candidatus Dadabacteria bacterium]|nr:SDR family oxidoreductase [Candidatus Dadabacteria bacterium]MYA47972.1 SDR family oxidoreductase [Candidatus Dadabacteria bacterium]MYG82841.1 SDR family oxidoreductase [Candidatus Dadabacteria bacterium]MYK49158.1 SDR family oxidoreductase [Candidatus Dadabacteria bacterium]